MRPGEEAVAEETNGAADDPAAARARIQDRLKQVAQVLILIPTAILRSFTSIINCLRL